jgi:Flp pilus assembly protein TadG
MSAIHKLGGAMDSENKIASIRLLPARRLRKSGERGATILEFAIAFVLTFVLIFGMIDFARALYSFHYLSNAAREGARFASVRGAACDPAAVTPCSAQGDDIQAFVRQIAPQGIDSTVVSVNQNTGFLWPNPNNLPICGTTPNYPGCTVQVQVSYPFNFIFPLGLYNSAPVSFQAGTINMSSTYEMIISR